MGYLEARPGGSQPPYLTTETQRDLSFGQLAAAVSRRRIVALMLFAAFMTLSVLLIQSLTPKYTSELLITLNMKNDSGGLTGSLSGGIVSKDMEELGTSINTITSLGAVRAIVDKLALQDDPEFDVLLKQKPASYITTLGIDRYLPQNIVKFLAASQADTAPPSPDLKREITVPDIAKRLTVTNDGKSYTIYIRFVANDPVKAAKIANAFGDWYVEHRKDLRSHQLDQISSLLLDKGDALRQQVIASQTAVEAYRQQHGIVNLGNDNTLNADALTKLNTTLVAARQAESEAQANLEEIQRFAENESPEAAAQIVGNAPTLVTLVDQQNQIKTRLAALSRTYLDSHPTIQAAKSQLSEVTQQLKAETDRVLSGLRARLQVAHNNTTQIATNLDQLTAANHKSARGGSELTQLESLRDADRVVYQTYLETVGRLGVAASSQAFDVEVTSPAVAPLWPSFPQKPLMLGLSAAVAAFLAIAVAIALDMVRRGIHSADELTAVKNLPVLGMVPRSRRVGRTPDRSLSMLAVRNPLGAHAEAIRSIGVSLLGSSNGQVHRTVVITSAVPGEGKTSLVLSLGRLAAAAGRSVLVMECDFRHPSLQRSLPTGDIGLVQVLSGVADLDGAIRVDEATGMRYLCAGGRALYPAELLNSAAMSAVIEQAKASYDLILVDTPPIGVVSDALVLSASADATILVLRTAKTDRRAFAMAVDRIMQFGVGVTGVVLSHVAPTEFTKYGSKREINRYFARSV